MNPFLQGSELLMPLKWKRSLKMQKSEDKKDSKWAFFKTLLELKTEKNCIPTRVKLSSLKPFQAGLR